MNRRTIKAFLARHDRATTSALEVIVAICTAAALLAAIAEYLNILRP